MFDRLNEIYNNLITEYKIVDMVPVSIHGVVTMMTEAKFRAFQLALKILHDENPEEWEEVVKDVVVYDDFLHGYNQPERMEFRANGCLLNEFQHGFLSASANLVIRML